MSKHRQGTPFSEYKPILASWDSKSAVRSKPRRMLSEDPGGQCFFSADLTPAASHPLVKARGPDQVDELLTRRLYSYLDFTAILEQEIVNPVVLRLSRDAYGLALPGDMQFDAYRIYCDEAYHALFSADIKRQVEYHTAIRSSRLAEPRFADAIRQAQQVLPPELHGLAELCAAVVSETLISGSLTKLPADPTVVEAIRHAIADHAADERIHHAYFTKVLEVVWPQIDSRVRRLLSPHFADFILAFLSPDERAQRVLLYQMAFSRDEAAQILAESHPLDQTLDDVRHAARSTIRLLQRTGVLDDSRTKDHFRQRGLLLEG